MLYVSKTVAVVAGSILIAVGINFFLIPYKILDGGIIGLALIIKYVWGGKVGLASLLLSLPMFILAWFKYRPFFYTSISGLLLSSLFIDFAFPYQFHFMYYIELDPISSALLGGLLIGLGIGVMLRYHTSTGGTDLLARIVADKTAINVGVVILILDTAVVVLGGIMISYDTFLLSIISITIGSMATALCTHGTKIYR